MRFRAQIEWGSEFKYFHGQFIGQALTCPYGTAYNLNGLPLNQGGSKNEIM